MIRTTMAVVIRDKMVPHFMMPVNRE